MDKDTTLDIALYIVLTTLFLCLMTAVYLTGKDIYDTGASWWNVWLLPVTISCYIIGARILEEHRNESKDQP